MAVAGGVADTRPIEAEKSGQSVQTQFPLENRESVLLEMLAAHARYSGSRGLAKHSK